MVQYSYDAWGRLLTEAYGWAPEGVVSTELDWQAARVNPFRYKGYFYDTETGLYYLNSRYYDPVTVRFINEDRFVSTGQGLTGYNMYAYCENNPVNYANPVGLMTNTMVSKSIMQCVQGCSSSIDFPAFSAKKYMFSTGVVVLYNVPLYDQGHYKLCWAFCQIMIEDFQAGIIRSNAGATDAAINIAKKKHGEVDWDKKAWPETVSEEIEGINSIDDLYIALNKYGSLYAHYMSGDITISHLIVVTGVNKTKGVVYTNNPWGISGAQKYSQFLQGFVGMPGSYNAPLHCYKYEQ